MNMNDIKEKVKNIKKEQIIIFCVGLVIGLLTMVVFYPERIAELKNGEEVAIRVSSTDITADAMYIDLKDNYALNSLLSMVDKTILDKKYEMSEEDNKSVDDLVTKYIENAVSNYSMSEEDFLERSGFESKEDFREYLELDYKRNKYYEEYMLGSITDDEVNSYYNDNVFGTINTEHILVQSEKSNALEKAQEILDKLKNGASWGDLKNEYKNDIITEVVPIDFDSNLESAYVEAAKKLSDGAYTSSLVKTSYGYHIIMRTNTDEKMEQKDLVTRIKQAIIVDKQNNDSNIYEKVMIKMRELEGLDIKDTIFKRTYETYVKKYSE